MIGFSLFCNCNDYESVTEIMVFLFWVYLFFLCLGLVGWWPRIKDHFFLSLWSFKITFLKLWTESSLSGSSSLLSLLFAAVVVFDCFPPKEDLNQSTLPSCQRCCLYQLLPHIIMHLLLLSLSLSNWVFFIWEVEYLFFSLHFSIDCGPLVYRFSLAYCYSTHWPLFFFLV